MARSDILACSCSATPSGNRNKARELSTEAIAMYRHISIRKHADMGEALLGEVWAPLIRISWEERPP